MAEPQDELDRLQRTVQSEIVKCAGNPDELDDVRVWVSAWKEAITLDMQADLEPSGGSGWRAAVSKIALYDTELDVRVANLARLERFVKTQGAIDK